MKKVLVTGAEGFIGKNLCISLSENKDISVVKFTRKSQLSSLNEMVKDVDFIFHLAGTNRPQLDSDFTVGNADLTAELCNAIRHSDRKIPIIFSSSIQAESVKPYGTSKLQAEMHLLNLHTEIGNACYIYRLPNVFGKWCRPNYNSVVATFCHNIINEQPIQIDDPSFVLNLVHINDVISSFLDTFSANHQDKTYINISTSYKITLGDLAERLYKFKESRESLLTEDVGIGLNRLLYSTYISYLEPEQFSYPVAMHSDSRGVFVEMLKTKTSGQFSYFTAKPGVTRGGHYHHVKTEKFLVLSGQARFGFKNISTNDFFEKFTSGNKAEIVETIPGWSHNITNVGSDELVVMLWANEVFDRDFPDTIPHSV